MRILKSHNDYRCSDSDQIKKAYKYFIKNKDIEKYDELLVEADVIYSKAKVRLAHEESNNPLKVTGIVGWSGKWAGILKDYLNKADDYSIKYMMVEFKDQSKDCFKNTMVLLNRHPKITFLLLNYKYPITLANCKDYTLFERDNTVITKDFY